MPVGAKASLTRGAATRILISTLLVSLPAGIAQNQRLFAAVTDGWLKFCVEYDAECRITPSMPRDCADNQAWTDLVRANRWVNANIWPITDVEYWVVVEC